jgi:hypothetical protein
MNVLASGSVRMFQSFVRALKIGFGLTLGSKFGVWIMEAAGIERAGWGVENIEHLNCPEPDFSLKHLHWWRFVLFIPVSHSHFCCKISVPQGTKNGVFLT